MRPFKTLCLFCILAFAPTTVFAQTTWEEVIAIIEDADDSHWRSVDPENMLLMDLPSGEIVIEMRPDLAPKHVEQIKKLTRQGFYNGIVFHRVIEGFMAQGGDPTGTGSGDSDLPNIPPEFVREESEITTAHFIGRDYKAPRVGFIGSVPVAAEPDSLKGFLQQDEVGLWGVHCGGVMSMARTNDPTSANSQFFLMFGDARQSLDQKYTVWGRIVDGIENSRRISRGEPPVRPTPIVRMRVASDVPESERPNVSVFRTETPKFKEYLKKTGRISESGFIQDVCTIRVPSKVNGDVEL